jgi:hypothetical protein
VTESCGNRSSPASDSIPILTALRVYDSTGFEPGVQHQAVPDLSQDIIEINGKRQLCHHEHCGVA